MESELCAVEVVDWGCFDKVKLEEFEILIVLSLIEL